MILTDSINTVTKQWLDLFKKLAIPPSLCKITKLSAFGQRWSKPLKKKKFLMNKRSTQKIKTQTLKEKKKRKQKQMNQNNPQQTIKNSYKWRES
jgi:hypothetical protein